MYYALYTFLINRVYWKKFFSIVTEIWNTKTKRSFASSRTWKGLWALRKLADNWLVGFKRVENYQCSELNGVSGCRHTSNRFYLWKLLLLRGNLCDATAERLISNFIATFIFPSSLYQLITYLAGSKWASTMRILSTSFEIKSVIILGLRFHRHHFMMNQSKSMVNMVAVFIDIDRDWCSTTSVVL